MRAMVVYVSVAGLLMFFCDAFQMGLAAPIVLLLAFVPVAIFTVMSISKIFFFAGLGVSVVGAGIFVIASGNPVNLAIASFAAFYNQIMFRLASAGYRTGAPLQISASTNFSETALIAVMVEVMAIILAIICTLSLIKRTHVLPLLITGILLCSVIFTYNISSQKWSFAMILTALCGILVLRMYDGIFCRDKVIKFKESATGGYAGFAAMVLTFVILFIPVLNMNYAWKEIKFINGPMEYARAVLSTMIIGETPNRGDLGFLANLENLTIRSTDPTPREFINKELVEVQAGYNTQLYLRSWIGEWYKENNWYSATSSEVEKYWKTFPEDFSPEDITYNYYAAVNENLVALSSSSSYYRHEEDGFITVKVHLKSLNSHGNLLFVPAVMDPNRSIMVYGSKEGELYAEEWRDYHDGIYLTSWFNFNKEYLTVSFANTYISPNYATKFENNLKYYEKNLEYVEMFYKDPLLDPATLLKELTDYLAAENITYKEPTILARFMEMPYDEQGKFYTDHISRPAQYTEYVKSVYLDTANLNSMYVPMAVSDIKKSLGLEETIKSLDPEVIKAGAGVEDISNLPTELLEDIALSTLPTHTKVMAVVDYLKDNYTYTLEPKESTKQFLDNAIDVFLGDIKEGYCVQFATAATMILREMGVPTRYCEGLLASDLTRNAEKEGRVANFKQTLTDRNAHAWIEVYVEHVGWLTYETTPEYYDDMYKLVELDSSGMSSVYDGTSFDIEIPETEETLETEEIIDPEETIEEEPVDPEIVKRNIKIAAFVVLLVIVIAFIVAMIKRSDNALYLRSEMVDSALNHELDERESHEVAKYLAQNIANMHNVQGLAPELGELPSEFATRVDENTEFATECTFAEVQECIEKEEFGFGMTKDDLKKVAEYMLALNDDSYIKLNFFQRIWFRHFKRII